MILGKTGLVVCLLLAPLYIGICFAAHPLISDDAETLGRGNGEIEINGEYEWLRDHGVRERNMILGSTVSYGFIGAGDIVLSAPYLVTRTREVGGIERERGFGDVLAEFKWRWYEKDGVALALKPGLLLPTGNDRRGLGAGKAGYEIFFICTRELANLVLHGNAGYLRNENTLGERRDLWHLSLAGEYPFSRRVTLVANAGADRDPDPARVREQAFVLGGAIWAVSERCALDGGLKYGFARGNHAWSVLSGLTFQL